MLTSDEIDFKPETVTRDIEDHYIMMKGQFIKKTKQS